MNNSEDAPRDLPANQQPDSPGTSPAVPVVAYEATPIPDPAARARAAREAMLPPDLRVPWGWGDLGFFLVFYLASTFVISISVVLGAAAIFHLSLEGLDKNPRVVSALIFAQVLISLGALLYLGILASHRRAGGFWRGLGWKPLGGDGTRTTLAAVAGHVVAGVVLAIIVGVAEKHVGPAPPVPFEQLFQTKQTILMLMAFGILLAPLVEEIMFRGFLYPVVARTFGIVTGVLGTGIMFGAFHAQQLWGAWAQIGLLMGVGAVLTYARARSGTVLASFLIHVTYNSTIFLSLLYVTHGLRDLSQLH